MLIWSFLALALCAELFRMIRSVEVTDEIHGIASIINIIQGQKPIVSSWDYHTGWCLLAPFYSLFIALNHGSREGIVLFSRTLFLAFGILIIGFTAYLMRKTEKSAVSPAVLGVIAWVPFSIFQLNYNSLTVYLLLLGTVLIQCSNSKYMWFVSGVVFGLACINYPTIAGAVLLITVIIAVAGNNGRRKAGIFFSGVAATGIIFTAWILIGVSPDAIKAGIAGMLSSPHEANKESAGLEYIKITFADPLLAFARTGSLIFPFTVIQAVLAIAAKRYPYNRVLKLLPVFIYSAYVIFISYYYMESKGMVFFSAALYISSLVWVVFDQWVRARDLIPYYLITTLFSVTYGFTSDNMNFLLGLMCCNVITAFASIMALSSWFENSGKEVQDREFSLETEERRLLCFILSMLLFVIPGIACGYSYVYRDRAVSSLNTKVEEGVFKGLYTTADREEMVVEMEHVIRQQTSKDDTMCVVTREPMLYVMSEAQICSPQTWDPQFLSRGYTSAEPLLSYYEMLDRGYPDVMAATNSAPEDFFQNDEYEIKAFIDSNYEQYYMKNVQGNTLCLWRSIE